MLPPWLSLVDHPPPPEGPPLTNAPTIGYIWVMYIVPDAGQKGKAHPASVKYRSWTRNGSIKKIIFIHHKGTITETMWKKDKPQYIHRKGPAFNTHSQVILLLADLNLLSLLSRSWTWWDRQHHQLHLLPWTHLPLVQLIAELITYTCM